MDNKRFVLILTLLSAGAALALHIRGHQNAAIQPLTITYHWLGYNGETLANPVYARTEIVAVRADGSLSRAHLNGPIPERKAWYVLKITDLTNLQYVVVDQLTESRTTYRSPAMLERFRVMPATACPGLAGDPILGFDTFVEETTKQFPRSEMKAKSWRAAELNCLPLREEVRMEWTDGSGRKSLKTVNATAVALGDPQAWLFEVPPNYAERTPNEVLAEGARRLGQSAPRFAQGLEDAYREAQVPKK